MSILSNLTQLSPLIKAKSWGGRLIYISASDILRRFRKFRCNFYGSSNQGDKNESRNI